MPMDEMMERGPMESESKETPCVYLTKADLGGKTYKKGDTLTLTVTDIDPESGDIEAEIAGGGEPETETENYNDAFDRAMPPEEE